MMTLATRFSSSQRQWNCQVLCNPQPRKRCTQRRQSSGKHGICNLTIDASLSHSYLFTIGGIQRSIMRYESQGDCTTSTKKGDILHFTAMAAILGMLSRGVTAMRITRNYYLRPDKITDLRKSENLKGVLSRMPISFHDLCNTFCSGSRVHR